MSKNLIFMLVLTGLLFVALQKMRPEPTQVPLLYSEFIADVQDRQVERVIIDGQEITGTRKDGRRFQSVRPSAPDQGLMDDLLYYGVIVEGRLPAKQSLWIQLLITSFPILLIIAAFMFLSRHLQSSIGGRNGPLSFGRNRARMQATEDLKTTFKDVAGADEAKEEVQELVDFLRDPERFERLGGRIPSGVLMVGAPGTGKTLLARAIAGEAQVAFFSISGSDFVEMFVGVGASRVRDMFNQARKVAPCIVFIDEIDAVGRHRGAGLGGGHDEREQTLNQLLVEMDGFESQTGIIVIAATNRPDVLDPALLRPGRFDRQVVVSLPDIRGRSEILQVHMRKLELHEDVDPEVLAKGTPGFSGADLANLCNEAALGAARVTHERVCMEDFDEAKDKLMMGRARPSMVMSEHEKRITAYHEAGHAIIGRLAPDHDPVYKVSIVPHGRALGVTMFLPEEERHSNSRRSIMSKVCSLFGGRVAEELILGVEGITTGASNDIRQATEIVRHMVMRWGLSDKMGPLLYDSGNEEVFLGRVAASGQVNISQDTARQIDQEVHRIMMHCYSEAKRLLEENMVRLHAMASALIRYESLDHLQISDIMDDQPPRAPRVVQPAAAACAADEDAPETPPSGEASPDDDQPPPAVDGDVVGES